MTGPPAAEAGRLAVVGAVPMSKNRCKVALVESLVRRTLLSLVGRGVTCSATDTDTSGANCRRGTLFSPRGGE